MQTVWDSPCMVFLVYIQWFLLPSEWLQVLGLVYVVPVVQSSSFLIPLLDSDLSIPLLVLPAPFYSAPFRIFPKDCTLSVIGVASERPVVLYIRQISLNLKPHMSPSIPPQPWSWFLSDLHFHTENWNRKSSVHQCFLLFDTCMQHHVTNYYINLTGYLKFICDFLTTVHCVCMLIINIFILVCNVSRLICHGYGLILVPRAEKCMPFCAAIFIYF